MPFFTNPAAIWGSLIFFGLIAVYIYRRRSRNIVVSSLMFFAKSKSTAEGGQKLHKLQTPLIFYLELLIFLFFIFALANPMALQKGQLVPLTIVLDDSLSMTAGNENSAYSLSLKYLKDKVFSESVYRITIIKAGIRPSILGRRDMTSVEAANIIRNWKCESATSNIMIAVSQAIEMGSDDGVILVLTDHSNNNSTSDSIKWLSFGTAKDNMAITSANRNSNGRVDRCFFEFTNFSDKSKALEADILDASTGKIYENISEYIEPKSSRRFIIKIFEQDAVIKAKIKNDDIDYDNEVILLPVKREKIKVGINVENKALAESVKKAVLSTEMVELNNRDSELLVTDKNKGLSNSTSTQLIIHNATQSVVVARSLSSDKEHSISSDLPIDNFIWIADSTFKQIGKNILVAGTLPLICVDGESNYISNIYLNYSFNLSDTHRTLFWPVFFYNIIEWVSHRQPGPTDFNYKTGSIIEVIAEKGTNKISIQKDNSKSSLKENFVVDRKVSFIAGTPGLYKIRDGEKTYKVSVNLCSYEESDLTGCDNTKEIPVIVAKENMSHFESVRWWFVLIAFLLLGLHQWLISKRRAGYAF